MIVKTLSLRQPWAWLVVDGVKTVENRKWKTKFKLPLPFLIHAALAMTPEEFDFAEKWCGLSLPPDPAFYIRGGIIGAALITEIVPPGSTDGGIWHMKEQYGYKLEGIMALPFRPLRGALNFFDVEASPEEAEAIKKLTPISESGPWEWI